MDYEHLIVQVGLQNAIPLRLREQFFSLLNLRAGCLTGPEKQDQHLVVVTQHLPTEKVINTHVEEMKKCNL